MNCIPHTLRILAVGLSLKLVACAAPIPKVQDFDHFNEQYSMLISHDIDILHEKHAAGLITREQMDGEIQRYEDERYQRVNELVEHSHRLKQSYAKTFGIPIGGPGRILSNLTSGRQPQFNPRAGSNIPSMSSINRSTGFQGSQSRSNR